MKQCWIQYEKNIYSLTHRGLNLIRPSKSGSQYRTQSQDYITTNSASSLTALLTNLSQWITIITLYASSFLIAEYVTRPDPLFHFLNLKKRLEVCKKFAKAIKKYPFFYYCLFKIVDNNARSFPPSHCYIAVISTKWGTGFSYINHFLFIRGLSCPRCVQISEI
jgi:hypothetical protein